MLYIGQDIIDIGSTKVGQKYVFGAVVPLDNPAWQGPWDCAEFASWCSYRAYGLIFGAGGAKKPASAEPYSGHWYADSKKFGHVISWQDALKIPGAALIRAPTPGKIGHVAFAIGDDERTLEARGAAFGVNIFGGAKSRSWTIGCLLPGVEYGSHLPTETAPTAEPDSNPPKGLLWLRRPNFKGPHVLALQKALLGKAIDPGPIDGEFGPMTAAAVLSFQVSHGLEVDGVVGPATAAALGLPFPITASAQDTDSFHKTNRLALSRSLTLPSPPADFDAIANISQSGKSFFATTASGERFIIGSVTRYTDDMTRAGLFQGKSAIKDSMRFGVYKGQDYTTAFGKWAHFIEPTLSAEGGARFATINTYDRAAFTFGAPQLAAHTPAQNFVVYFRQLLALPEADRHFPELSLRGNGSGDSTIHLKSDTGFIDLEEPVLVTRPNGKKEKQLARLMNYLNASPAAIDEAELSVSARLMNWLRLDPKAKELQIAVFIAQAKENLARAKTKVPGFDGSNWEVALWIMDILHQGRGTFAEMSTALASRRPVEELRRIGILKYKTRIETVSRSAKGLTDVLHGFTV
ncbi:peptidoglycan-binding domain-containing protein [Sinorhizobium fredii]|uniref:Peptidoglycan-binding domain-containing protein n=1 Tax=Rhizobium fredii TaxID=380 RepID=A0A2L0HA15_RHIFR|nr:peptidoglycan-binding domain-containing protein [Sinorhizobium fredii]AUX78338.1 peptidoglycan-binding domain-containing protein [Sinorhizobium fredii]